MITKTDDDISLRNGAIINSTHSSCHIVILQNDHVNGLFQIMNHLPKGKYLPMKQSLHIWVKEGR